MTDIESSALIDYSYYKHKLDWELARFIGLCSVTPFAKKQLTPLDLISFEWELLKDDDAKNVDWERIEELKLMALKYERK